MAEQFSSRYNLLKMKPELKSINSPDINLDEIEIMDFIYVDAWIGPQDSEASEVFGFYICNSKWIKNRLKEGPIIGAGYIIVHEVNYQSIWDSITLLCGNIVGDDWDSISCELAKAGYSEYE